MPLKKTSKRNIKATGKFIKSIYRGNVEQQEPKQKLEKTKREKRLT